MLVVVLDYTDGSVHFHRIPEDFDTLYGLDDIEDYLSDQLDYSIGDINWMEVKC